VSIQSAATRQRPLLHPHRQRIALVARPARGPSDHALASWVRSHAATLRWALDFTGRHAAETEASAEAVARLAELETMTPERNPER
jgi:hypothetical protein